MWICCVFFFFFSLENLIASFRSFERQVEDSKKVRTTADFGHTVDAEAAEAARQKKLL